MQFEKPGIQLFSPTFHKSFFLPLLLRKLKPSKKTRTLAAAGTPIEYTILPGGALACMVIGLMHYQAMSGRIIGILGACGFLIMLLSSVRSHLKSRQKTTWEDFRPFPLLFLVLTGVTTSLCYTGGIVGAGIGMKITGAAAGLLIGYLVGIPAGFWFQSLGWITTILEILLVPLMMGLFVVSILMVAA